ncbi:RNA polymerase sigma-70 factor [Pedobacter antarcticus]|uniref:RNA polymerase sigma factor n=1 Tax=Pedobacter antarcticus TaxID=34086 RepID=UPI002931337F|nr:RNA polymerase sigma-70 factor [Pedobacter antarcticus]
MATQEEAGYWMEAFRNGNDQALAYYFKHHNKSVTFFASRLVQDSNEAEDIVADCFVKIWRKRDSFQTEEHIKAFLYVSCRNACLDYLRQLKVRSRLQADYLNSLQEEKETILYQIITAEVLEILYQQIELLPDNYREVFKLIYFDHLKTDEIASRLELSVQTVRNYKSRAVELLKNSMLKNGLSGAFSLAFLLFLDGR